MARDEKYDGPTFAALRGVTAVGNLTRDPKEVPSKNPGAGFGVALNSIDYTGFKGKMFLNCIAWEHQADQALENYGKGDKVIIIGDLSIGEFDDEPQFNFTVRQIAKVLYADGDGDRGSSRRSSRDDDGDEDSGSGRSSSRSSGRRNRDDDEGESRSSSRGSSRRSSRDDDGDEDSGSGRRSSGRRSSRDDDSDEDSGRSSGRSSGRRSSGRASNKGDDLDD